MSGSKIGPQKFSRRSFIKGAAAVTAAGALVGSLSSCTEPTGDGPNGTTATTEIFAGVCRANDSQGCFLNVHVRDGRIVRTTARDLPNTEYNRICTRGITQVGRIYSAERIRYPMKRVGERGSGEFERISWEEAIDLIVENWTKITDQYGPGAMSVMYGTGNGGICSGAGSTGAHERFIAVMGCSVIPINVDAAHGRATGVITGAGLSVNTFAYGNNNTPTDIKNSKTFIGWGANPAVSQLQMMHFILEAQDNGMRYIVIDPVYNANASKADWFIPINATTDGVLAFGALNEVFSQGWEDVEFIRAHTEAPLLVKDVDGMLLRMSDLGVPTTEGPVDPMTGQPTVIDPYAVWDEETNSAVALEEAKRPALEGVTQANGIAVKLVYDILKERVAAYPPATASQICGVPEADIKELARIYAQDGPVNTNIMFGDNHYINGHYNYWPMYALSICTGNSGRPGAACGFGYLSSAMIVANPMAAYMPMDAEGNMAQGSATRLLMNKVGEVIETGKFAGSDRPLKGVYIHNSNLMSTMAQHEKTEAWVKAMDFVLVSDISMTETAQHADIVLPAAHWFEQVDVYPSLATMPYMIWQEKATEPLYESKTEWEIYKLITSKMDLGQFFDMTEEDFIALYLDNDVARSLGITLEALKEQKAMNMLPTEPFITFEGGQYATATGRARFYQDTVVPDYNVGQTIDNSKEMAPYWEPSLEADINSEARKKYPYHVISEHLRTRTHTQWWDVEYHKSFEPEPVVRFNPDDARELNIGDGDQVRLYNDRGSVVMKATISAGVPPKTLTAARSFQKQEFIEGHFASISTNQYNQVCANQAFNDVAVAVEKI